MDEPIQLPSVVVTNEEPQQPTQPQSLLSLNPSPQESAPLIPLDIKDMYKTMSPELAAQRAFTAGLGTSKYTKKSYDDLYNSFINGGEQSEREYAASSIDLQTQQNVQEVLAQTLGNKITPMTQHEANVIANYVRHSSQPTDPSSVFEETLAEALTDDLEATAAIENTNSPINRLRAVDQPNWEVLRRTTSDTATKVNYLKKLVQDAEEEVSKQSYIGRGADILKSAFPFYNSIKQRGSVDTVGFFSGTLSDNILEQSKQLFRLPPAEFKRKADAIYERLVKDNPGLAKEYFDKLIGQNSIDAAIGSAFEVLDPLLLYSPSKAGKAIISGNTARNEAVKSLFAQAREQAKSNIKENAVAAVTSKATVAEASGNLAEASVQRVVKNIDNATSPALNGMDVVDAQVSFLRAAGAEVKGSNNRRELANRVWNAMDSFADTITDAINATRGIQRTPVIGEEAMIRIVQDEQRRLYPELSNNVMDLSAPIYRDATKDWVMHWNLGLNDGTLFSAPETARFFAEYNGIKSAEVIPQGSGYYIRITKPISETSDIVRDNLYKLYPESHTPRVDEPSSLLGTIKSWAGYLRTPEETMSLAERSRRKIATNAPSNFEKLVKEASKPIQDLTRGISFMARIRKSAEYHDLSRMINVLKNTPDPATGKSGRWFNTIDEVDGFFQLHYKRNASDKEIEAYFAYKTLSEMDYIFRALTVYANKTKVGAEGHNIIWHNKAGEKMESGFIDGVRKDKLPGGQDLIAVFDNNGRLMTFFGDSLKNQKDYKRLTEDIKKGIAKVVELYDPETKPLAHMADELIDARVRYVVSYRNEVQPISLQQLERRGGGHIEYNYPYYIKQAKVHIERIGSQVKSYYEGDTTIAALKLPAMGKQTVKVLNEIRVLIGEAKQLGATKKAGTAAASKSKWKEAEAKALELPNGMDWKQVKSWFEDGFDKATGKRTPPMLNVREEIKIVGKDQRIIDMDNSIMLRHTTGVMGKGQFIDGTRRSSLARSQSVAYTQQRDAYELMAIHDVGTKSNPLYTIAPAEFIDPMLTANKALHRIINTNFMNDYKSFAIENWIARAIQYQVLNASPEEVRASPYFFFLNSDNTMFKSGADTALINELRAQRMQIKQLVGEPSATQAAANSINHKFLSVMYSKFGPKGIIYDPVELSITKDPFKFARSIAFHTTLGMFNPLTILTNMQSLATISGVAGLRKAITGSYGSTLYRFASVNSNDAIMKHLDTLASKMRIPGMDYFKPGHWLEATNELRATGWANVTGTHATLDNVMPKTITSRGRAFLDAGTIFFRQSEEQLRLISWYTAYQEFRAKNPTKLLTNKDRDWLIDRADLLNGNMTRASNAILNQGMTSLPLQFFTYTQRAAELMTGKRLTQAEKFRLITTHSALYGLPVALGLTGIPFSENFRKSAIENGYTVGQNYLDDAITNGIPATMIYMITGRQVNIGDRFGVGGYAPLKEAMRSDGLTWKMIFGAAGSKLVGAIEAVDPFIRYVLSMARQDGQTFNLTSEHMLQAAREINLIKTGYQAWTAYKYGTWLSKKDELQMKVGSAEGAIMALTGVSPQETVDRFLMQETMATKKQREGDIIKKFSREFGRALDTQNNNPEQFKAYMANAFSYLQYLPETRWSDAMEIATKNREPAVERIAWQYFLKDIPNKDAAAKMQAYQRYLRNIHQIDRRQ